MLGKGNGEPSRCLPRSTPLTMVRMHHPGRHGGEDRLEEQGGPAGEPVLRPQHDQGRLGGNDRPEERGGLTGEPVQRPQHDQPEGRQGSERGGGSARDAADVTEPQAGAWGEQQRSLGGCHALDGGSSWGGATRRSSSTWPLVGDRSHSVEQWPSSRGEGGIWRDRGRVSRWSRHSGRSSEQTEKPKDSEGSIANDYDPKMHGWRDTWDPWAEAAATRHLGRRESGQQSEGNGGERATEKIPVPTFSGLAGEEGEVGSTARSYLRRVEAWERVTRMTPNQRGVALYTALKDKAWVEAEALSIERLSVDTGTQYFKDFIKQRYMDVEVTQVGRIMSQFFRVLKRGNDESVRTFTGEFDRMVARLAEVQVVLPETVLAWMYVDKLRLDEAGEISLLASVRNEYSLKRLQEAALIHDRSLRKPYEESRLTRKDYKGKPWRGEVRAPRGVNMAEPGSEEETRATTTRGDMRRGRGELRRERGGGRPGDVPRPPECEGQVPASFPRARLR